MTRGPQSGTFALLLALSLPGGIPLKAQDSNELTCSSNGRGRTFCTADTRGGVQLLRSNGRVICQQGRNWDFDTRGVWVDQGCDGDFSLSSARPRGQGPGRRSSTGSLAPGTTIMVRTNERIDTRKLDGRVFSAVVQTDVLDAGGNVAIPRGSEAELLVRSATNRELTLDLDSVIVNGERYAVSADTEVLSGGQKAGIGSNQRTAKFVGGGALLGTLLGAIAGGGQGAAIGAAAGAGAGAGTQLLTRGSAIRVPVESILTFQLDQTMQIGIPDRGVNRRGRHYHQN